MNRIEFGSVSLERSFLAVVFLAFFYVLLFFAESKLGMPHGRRVLALLAGGVVAWGFLRYVGSFPVTPARFDRRDALASLCVVLAAGAGLFALTQVSHVMTGNDPIIVPTLADSLLSHATTMEVYRPGDPGFTYPPGYPILFSAVSALVPAMTAIFLFKVLSIALVLVLPVGWAWIGLRVFRIGLPFWLLLCLSYLATFGLERTATYTLEHGKNSQVLAGALLPFLIGILMLSSRRWSGVIYGTLAMTGAILVHYSIIYMVAAFFAGYVLVHLPRRREDWMGVLRLGVSGILSLGLFALLMRAAFNDPRAGGFGLGGLMDGLKGMAAVLLGKDDILLFIFNESNSPDIRHSPYRGLVLIACVALPLVTGWLLRRGGGSGRPFAAARMAGVWGIMLLLQIAFATGTLRVGITPDFARWQMIFPQAALFFTALCAIVCYGRSGLTGSPIAYMGTGAAMAVAVLLAAGDFRHIVEVFALQRVEKATLVHMRDELAGTSPCFLITDSFTIADELHTVQTHRPLEYAEILTGCPILNGSFVQRGVEGGRAIGGLPDASVLAALPADSRILLIASEPVKARYQAALPAVGFEPQDSRIGPLPVWRVRPR
ncbi:hypothetical protein [Azospirillum sp. TSO35-2]|uniref:hypothetical protein n=1 Tax=Azospirillum sp. TSO35-2 TaxID=716796 RepID=UPI000D641B3B|nr:hypothetical protein [Azospirillum sp. TSO35-2]